MNCIDSDLRIKYNFTNVNTKYLWRYLLVIDSPFYASTNELFLEYYTKLIKIEFKTCTDILVMILMQI